LVSASQHNTDTNTFSAELQQLGLPKEHSSALCRVMDEYSGEIRKYLASRSLTVNELADVSFNIPPNTIDCAQLVFKIKNEIVNGVSQPTTHRVNVSKVNILTMLNELKVIKNIVDTCDYEKKYNEN
jgi:COMM domain containing 4